ncbi:hypothetical protein BDB00DRAFT_869371 [Zychaea mexicana]|uniref:uncharacterized protein n=1 Tax=Zychaea mexicana TaxID=64656 RepID=UPI0022FE7804|nr:uncharacterized protein BDB00DRAFT_869371 [Zychaea mexicana]KAI9496432.1 hypothetical protein BDB00DRAFT_869371 [Zychaea mexicana]
MSYFARVRFNDWKVEDAIKYHKEKNPDADKLPLQLVLDDLSHLAKGDHNGKGEAAWKFLSTMENILKAQSCQVTGGNISVGNISSSVTQIGNTVQVPEGSNINVNVKLKILPILYPRWSSTIDMDVEEPFPCDLSPIISNIYSPKEPEGLDDSFWMIGDFDVVSELKTFWEVSSHLAMTQGNISDTRILALHRIFPFLINQKDSITMYIDHHDEIFNELKMLTFGCPSLEDILT